MAKRLVANGEDITQWLTPWGYAVSYRKRKGPAEGMMADGSMTEDTLATKAVVSVPFMPMKESDAIHITQLMHQYKYAHVVYFDLLTGDYRMAQFIFTPFDATEKGKGADGEVYWTGFAMKLEER